MSFKIIETQDELDEIISKRLARQAEKYEGFKSPDEIKEIEEGFKAKLAKFNGFTSPEKLDEFKSEYETKIKEIESNLEKIKSENSGLKLEKMRFQVAYEFRIPRDMASRIQGQTIDEMKSDVESLSKFVRMSNFGFQEPSPESPVSVDPGKQAIRKLVSQLHD